MGDVNGNPYEDKPMGGFDMTQAGWTCALELAPDRSTTSGSPTTLSDAIRRGADLRVYTEWRVEEHLVPYGDLPPRPENDGVIQEIIDFRQTFLLDDCHVAAITTLRQPLAPTVGFNGRQPKMSFFLYNMNGQQCCASLVLDDASTAVGQPGTRQLRPVPPNMPKMSAEEVFDLGTTAPSRNFIYDMEVYRFWVRDEWSEIFAHDSDGSVTFGDFEAVKQAQAGGRELKVAIRNLCGDLGAGPGHEVFSLLGSSFLHTRRNFYEVATHPMVRVAPAIPLRYASFNWDVCWAFLRTDGFASLRSLNPYTRVCGDQETRFACRWFVR